jgi:hypothetical protein
MPSLEVPIAKPMELARLAPAMLLAEFWMDPAPLTNPLAILLMVFATTLLPVTSTTTALAQPTLVEVRTVKLTMNASAASFPTLLPLVELRMEEKLPDKSTATKPLEFA